MRQFLGISLLVFVLAGSAFAGEIPNEIASPPPSPPTGQTAQPTTDTIVIELTLFLQNLLPRL
jgi:hypothetical protein